MTDRLWILGAPDVEMAAIERLLTDAGERIAYATVEGVRVHPGNAYRADSFGFAGADRRDGPVMLVECGRRDGHFSDDETVVDHHRHGDPGYGRPPEEFLTASSVGQVIKIMHATDQLPWGVHEIPNDILFTAAADHCLEAAYRGRCPGVDPDALMQWRAETRAAFQGRTVAEVLADVDRARAKLQVAVSRHEDEVGHLQPFRLADLRGQSIPELPEAAAREGIPFLATVTDRDGRTKVVLQAAGPELVGKFLAGEVVAGLTGYYGDPARGFAGGHTHAKIIQKRP